MFITFTHAHTPTYRHIYFLLTLHCLRPCAASLRYWTPGRHRREASEDLPNKHTRIHVDTLPFIFIIYGCICQLPFIIVVDECDKAEKKPARWGKVGVAFCLIWRRSPKRCQRCFSLTCNYHGNIFNNHLLKAKKGV